MRKNLSKLNETGRENLKDPPITTFKQNKNFKGKSKNSLYTQLSSLV